MSLHTDYLIHLATTPTQRGHLPAAATVRAARADLQGFVAWWEQMYALTFDVTLVLPHDLADWQRWRQVEEGARATSINRASSSLRHFFRWAMITGLIAANPTDGVRDVPVQEGAPRATPPEGIRWLERAIQMQDDSTTQVRDRALLTLLSDLGLRSQEAAAVQVRDLDLDGLMLTIRAGKRGKPRRVELTPATTHVFRSYLRMRCPAGLPALGSAAERESFLMGQHTTRLGHPWVPGMSTAAIRARIATLRDAAGHLIAAQIRRESDSVRRAALAALAREVARCSPHRLRHGLAYRLLESGATPRYVKDILGHSRLETALSYGRPTEEDKRAALERANRYSGRR